MARWLGGIVAVAAIAAVFGTGCVMRVRPLHHGHMHGAAGIRPHAGVVVRFPGAAVVAIDPAHVHAHHCGHFFHAGHWYFVGGHVHGPGCGHAFVGGQWLFVE